MWRDVAGPEVLAQGSGIHSGAGGYQTRVGTGGPGAGVSTPGRESAPGLGGRLVKCCWPGHSGGCSPSQLPAGGEPRPWPRVRLEQGSSVSGFENTPGNVLVEFSIYPGDNAF